MKSFFKKNYFYLTIIFLHLLVFFYQIANNHLYMVDSREYLTQAFNIKSYGISYCADLSKPIVPIYLTLRPPVYPFFILLCKTIINSDLFVVFIQNILSVMNLILMRNLLLQLGYNKRNDLFLLFFILSTPSQIIYANMIMSEILVQFFIILMMVFLVRLFYHYSNGDVWGYTFSLIAALFTKPVFYLLVFPNFLGVFFYGLRKRKWILILTAFIPLLMVVGYMQWNKQRTGYAEFSGITTLNIYNYNAFMLLQAHYEPETAKQIIDSIDRQASLIKEYKEQQIYFRKVSKELIFADWFTYAILHLKGMIYFFIDPGRFDIYSILNAERLNLHGLQYQLLHYGWHGLISYFSKMNIGLLVLLFVVFLVNLIKIILFIQFLFNRKISMVIRGLFLFILIYVSFLSGPVGCSRFMVPVALVYLASVMLQLNSVSDRSCPHQVCVSPEK